MSQAKVMERTLAYIRENFLYARPDLPLGETDSLLGKGIVDSMGVMELVEFIQSEFGVEVKEEDITEDNLGTLRAISNYVMTQRSASVAA
jgi:acyl carrier protein